MAMQALLLVGPDPETLELLRLRFELMGFRVLTAVGCDAARAIIKAEKPIGCFLDLISHATEDIREAKGLFELAATVKAQCVLLLPRGIASPIPAAISKMPVKIFIRKPFELEVAARQLQKIFTSRKETSKKSPQLVI